MLDSTHLSQLEIVFIYRFLDSEHILFQDSRGRTWESVVFKSSKSSTADSDGQPAFRTPVFRRYIPNMSRGFCETLVYIHLNFVKVKHLLQ